MNALSDLASEVKFRERMRGYDYEEVDNYVKSVGRVAAQAKDRIAELEHRLAQVESQAGNGNDDGATEVRETLLRTLVLAQRTADSAVSEARSEAESITESAKERAAKTVSEAETAANERLRSAEERAARMLAESEENGQLIIAEAKRTAAAELASEREQAQAELRDLETSRSELETVVAEIQARLDSERDMLRGLAVSFQSFVEKFEPVADITQSDREPEAGESTDDYGPSDGAVAESEDAAAGKEAPPPIPADDIDGDHASEVALAQTLSTDADDAGTVPDVPVDGWDGEIGRAPSEDVDAVEPEPVGSDVIRLEPTAGGNGAAYAEPDDSVDPVRDDEVASAGLATMPFGVDSPELFDMDAEEDDEFIEQLRQVVSSDAPLPDGDAAMAAFFDHDDRSGSSGTRSGASDRGGRLGPRA